MNSQNKNSFKNGKAGAVIAVRVIPRSQKSGIVEIMNDGVIKIRIVSPPIEGKANDELIKVISKTIKCKKSDIEIISGLSAKTKVVAIYGFDPDKVDQLIRHKLTEIN